MLRLGFHKTIPGSTCLIRDLFYFVSYKYNLKRHKDVMGYFNKEYVAKEVFPREIGRKLGTLQRVREKSDYDDFYIASKEKATEQFQTAELVIDEAKKYLEKTQEELK